MAAKSRLQRLENPKLNCGCVALILLFWCVNDGPVLNDMVTGAVVSLHLVDQRDGVHFMSSSLITGFLLVDPEQLWVTGFRPLFAPTSVHLGLHK